MTGATVLFVDDEEHLRIAAEQTFDIAGLDCRSFSDGRDALDLVSREFNGVLVTDIRMPHMDGQQLMQRVLEADHEFPVILITGHGDIDMAVRCMRDGAYDFLEKPYAPARLVESVRRALDKRALTLENRSLRRKVGAGSDADVRMTGRSAIMTALRQQIRAIAQTDADVLILGETGTGKDIAAREIHRLSTRGDRPFVQINCAALPEALIESELFGHEAGAFAGATRARYGKFEHARGGIVCLDEIDSLAPALQAKLLHVIQNRSVVRLGSNDPVDLDIRIIAISKADLEDEIAAGRFRGDLYYRLNVVTLRLPDLADRRDDVPLLFIGLVAQAAEKYGKPVPEIPGAVLSAVAARDWPGNVRELGNAADRFVLGLDLDIGTPGDVSADGLAGQMANYEKSLISGAIAASGGQLKPVYEALQISRKALYQKMQRYGLAREDFTGDEP